MLLLVMLLVKYTMTMMKKMVMLMYKTKTWNSKTTLKRFLKISGQLLTETDNINMHTGKDASCVPPSACVFHFLQRYRRGICKYGPNTKSSLPLVSANKALSE